MTAVLAPLLGPGSQGQALDADRISRFGGVSAFAAILDGALPTEPTPAHPPVPEAIEAELKPRAKLGIWPTAPARFSPPKRGSATTSSAPAGPEDGPSGGPLTVDNVPWLEIPDEPAAPSAFRPGAPHLDLSELALESTSPTTSNAPLDFAVQAPRVLRRRDADPLARGIDALHTETPAPAEAREPEPTMWTDPFQTEVEGDAAEALETWEDILLSRSQEQAVRVEFDVDLAVEVRAVRGEVDVHVDGTWDAVDALGDIEYDLEQALADGGEHHLASYSQTRRDPTSEPQANGNRADPQDTPAVQQRRYAPGGRLFNGLA